MLVVTREENQVVIFADAQTGEVMGEVHIMSIRGNKVRVGFQFPKDKFRIDREEVFAKINRESQGKFRD